MVTNLKECQLDTLSPRKKRSVIWDMIVLDKTKRHFIKQRQESESLHPTKHKKHNIAFYIFTLTEFKNIFLFDKNETLNVEGQFTTVRFPVCFLWTQLKCLFASSESEQLLNLLSTKCPSVNLQF